MGPLVGPGPDGLEVRFASIATPKKSRARKTARGKPKVKARLTHLDGRGAAHMVDVGAKPISERIAVASARVRMKPATLALLCKGSLAKGDAFAIARLAGIQAAKQTATLIPLAHPIAISQVSVELTPTRRPASVVIEATVRTRAQTGVEMEALVAACVAALALYDMAKAADRGMRIEAVQLDYKAGGKSGTYRRTVGRKR